MISKDDARLLVNDLFEEEALIIGGLIAVHGIDDDFVWRLMKNINVIRAKVLRRIDARDADPDAKPPAERPNLTPHPAIEDFLENIKRA